MALITADELRKRVQTTISAQAPYLATKPQKLENIKSFINLPRTGLSYNSTECRILLYETMAGEKVYMQYPGSESARTGPRHFPNDARPILQKADGSFCGDMDFKTIWDIIDRIGRAHHDDIDILATIFLRIAYMIGYRHNEKEYLCETIDISTGRVISSCDKFFTWNSFEIDGDVLETLNDRFRSLGEISLEGFLYYNDLLAQNEDCKYYCLHGAKWNITTGRINNCLSHLTVISHIRGHIGISKLIDSFQRTGVAPLPQSRFEEACGSLVSRVR